jgi:hypothetical protein
LFHEIMAWRISLKKEIAIASAKFEKARSWLAHTLLFLVFVYLSARLNLFELRCWQYKVLFLGNDTYRKIREQLNKTTRLSLVEQHRYRIMLSVKFI